MSGLTRVRLLPPWRQSSDRPVPVGLPLYPANLAEADRQQTKIWDGSALPFSDADGPARQTSLGCWFVYAPWMHMAWAWHYCGLVHLRPVAGMPPPHLSHPGATHEFLVFALDPTADVIAEALRPLSPVSIVQQFDAASDAHARLIIEDALELVARGKCSVDSDFRPVWRHLLTSCEERPGPP